MSGVKVGDVTVVLESAAELPVGTLRVHVKVYVPVPPLGLPLTVTGWVRSLGVGVAVMIPAVGSVWTVRAMRIGLDETPLPAGTTMAPEEARASLTTRLGVAPARSVTYPAGRVSGRLED